MINVYLESENLIKMNGYNPIYLYGVIISYFNFYDYNTFENCINKLYNEQPMILFEILLVYNPQFLKPIKKEENEEEFFINFFEYIISEKDFSYFNKGLKFISDLDTFITVIEATKENIYNKYIKEDNNQSNFKSIKLGDNFAIKKEKINDIINGILSINKYSEKIKTILVYFKGDLWKSLLKEFNNSNPECFNICSKLRDTFLEYIRIINSICIIKKDKSILKDIIDYVKIDEFALILNKNIISFFEQKKGKLKNFEILGYIQTYNPFYNDDRYKYKRDLSILNYLVLEYDIYNYDEDIISDHVNFIETFKKLNYEDIFKANMVNFIDAMINKIKDISSFDTIIDLIRIDKIKENANEYLEKLKNKYELIVKPQIEKLSDNQIKRPVEIIAKFEKLIFGKENNFDFLENNLIQLKIYPLIYNQLMIMCKEDQTQSKINKIKRSISFNNL